MNIKKLAKKLNLSITTVSRGLGGYSDVNEVTREKIIKFAKKYNYSPNPNASNLASRKTNTLGFVIPLYGLNSNRLNQASFFEFISGMSKKINSENIQFIMTFANTIEEEKKAYEKLINQKVDKVILHNLKKNDSRIGFLKKNKVNFVGWGRTQGKIDYSWVDLDNEGSVNLIMNYLFDKNHKEIAFINVEEKYNFAYQRKQGYLKFLKQKKIKLKKDYYISVKNEDPNDSAQQIKKLILKNSKITAIICSTEYSAAGAIKALNQINKKIGKDISLITFDGSVVNSISSPSITAVTHDRKQLGKKAIEILTSNQKIKINYFLAKPKIIERGSVHQVRK
tara:strand:- start:1632 stop:2645 length:1014 start_codon:yes stop_codon:yes gene_type:complete